eukprot:TRINITY_DN30484_c0_g1_i2.p1 TRINITY_DN30484_c0_g1~~TRINITY_DN30484_c0_g1_i2.p1  ORF type:complete len:1050 (+),score=227.29 TRINITY_DN30484_c0_g1_i2:117-3266(+)
MTPSDVLQPHREELQTVTVSLTDGLPPKTPERPVRSAETPPARQTEAADGPAPSGLAGSTSADCPTGTGPLYKCAICGVLVFESQLDYHVSICPDPADSSTPPLHSAPLEHLAEEPEEDEEDEEEEEEQQEEATTAATASSPGHQRSVAEASISITSAVRSSVRPSNRDVKPPAPLPEQPYTKPRSVPQRLSKRGSEIVEELRKKEEIECTFQPKTLARGSPRTCTRLDLSADGRLSQRWEQRHKAERLKLVEAQAYVDCIHKPQISRFAREWSLKQSEAAPDGYQTRSCFERLYSAAIQSRIKKQAVAAEAEESVAGSQCSTLRPSRSRVTDLLYANASVRRERLRALADQFEARRQETARERTQVLSRSRRYYWNMLERQIRQAMEEITGSDKYGSDNFLRYEQLEDFLVAFGCARPSRELLCDGDGHVMLTAAEEEARRLRAALWRHLDPQKTGSVDLLTLTVFFHVLMGAVDGVSQASSQAAAGPPGPAGPPAAEHPLLHSVSLANGDGLAASDSFTSSITPGSPSPVVQDSLGVHVDDDDEDGKQIVEMLVNFDPVKLRSEFKTLYTQRLYYQSQHMPGERGDEDDGGPYAPEIDQKSRALAARVVEREKEQSGGLLTSHADVMLWRHQIVEAKKEEKRAQAKAEEVVGCTFKPQLLSRDKGDTSRGTSRNELLYKRAAADKERKLARAEEVARVKREEDLSKCTFKPNTGRSDRSYNRAHDGGPGPPAPRGFYESRQRMRGATEAARQRAQQREDRLAQVRPVEVSSQRTPPMVSVPVPTLLGHTADGSTVVGSSDRLLHVPLPSVAEHPPRRRESSPKGVPLSARGPRDRSFGHRSPSIDRPLVREYAGAVRIRSHSPRGGSPDAPAGHSGRGEVSTSPREKSSSSSAGYPTAKETSSSALAAGAATRSQAESAAAPPRLTQQALEAHTDMQEEQLGPPLLYVDVNIAPGQPPERIMLREGQSPAAVAADFAAKHRLTPLLAQRLHTMLQEVVRRQLEHTQQQGVSQQLRPEAEAELGLDAAAAAAHGDNVAKRFSSEQQTR